MMRLPPEVQGYCSQHQPRLLVTAATPYQPRARAASHRFGLVLPPAT